MTRFKTFPCAVLGALFCGVTAGLITYYTTPLIGAVASLLLIIAVGRLVLS